MKTKAPRLFCRGVLCGFQIESARTLFVGLTRLLLSIGLRLLCRGICFGFFLVGIDLCFGGVFARLNAGFLRLVFSIGALLSGIG